MADDDDSETSSVAGEETLQTHATPVPEEVLNARTTHFELLFTNDVDKILVGLVYFRKLLSTERNPPIQEIVNMGLLPVFIGFLSHADTKVKFETCWAICNIASGTSEHVQQVLNEGALPILIQMLTSCPLNNNNDEGGDDSRAFGTGPVGSAAGTLVGSAATTATTTATRRGRNGGKSTAFPVTEAKSDLEELDEQIIWTIGNIAGDSAITRDVVLKSGIVEEFARNPRSDRRVSTQRNTIWTISNLCRAKPSPSLAVLQPLLPTIAQYIHSTDDEVLTDAAWALSYVSDGANDRIEAVLALPAVPQRLLQLLTLGANAIVVPALRTIGNIATGDDHQLQRILDLGCLGPIAALLKSDKPGIRKEAWWCLSNCTAGTIPQIQAVIDANVFVMGNEVVEGGAERDDIKKELAWCYSNATSGGSPEQLTHFIREAKFLKTLLLLLKAAPDHDARVLDVVLEGMTNLFDFLDGEGADEEGNNNNDNKSKIGESERMNILSEFFDEGGLTLLDDLAAREESEAGNKAAAILEDHFDEDVRIQLEGSYVLK